MDLLPLVLALIGIDEKTAGEQLPNRPGLAADAIGDIAHGVPPAGRRLMIRETSTTPIASHRHCGQRCCLDQSMGSAERFLVFRCAWPHRPTPDQPMSFSATAAGARRIGGAAR